MIAAALLLGPLLQTDPSSAQALESARARLPERLRARVEGVEVVRRPDLGVPDAAPLDLRLFGRGALAFFDTSEGVVVVTDAGASGVATWAGPAPSADDVEVFLARIAPALDPADGSALDAVARWERFRDHVSAWAGRPLEGDLGDVRVLDAFLAEAPWRALGGRVPLEALLLHELAHAVQLAGDDFQARVLAWSAVTGWRERRDGSIADGVAGQWLSERPVALVRLLLDGPRGDSEYEPGGAADGVSPYALFDPREDFAEAARAMSYAPREFAAAHPARFMAINATGWVADLDASEPGPLWRGAEDLGAEAMAATVERGAREILARWAESEGDVDPAAFAAVLDAHAAWIPPDLVEPSGGAAAVARDLPPSIAAAADRAAFRVADGSRRTGPAEAVRACVDRAAVRHADLVAYTEGFLTGLGSFDGPRWVQAMAELDGLPMGRLRLDRMLAAIGLHGGDLTTPSIRDRINAEIQAFERTDQPWLALRLRIELRLRDSAGDDGPYPAPPGAHLTSIMVRSSVYGPSYDAVECSVAAARGLARLGDEEAALRAIALAEGDTWGAFRRSQVLLELGRRDRAETDALGVALAGLRDRALLDVAEAHARAGEVERARALLAEVGDTRARERALERLGQ